MKKSENNLEVLKGVGPVTKKDLISVGLTTYSAIARYDVAGLKKRLKKPRANVIWPNSLEAKLIAKGKFKNYLAYQDKLNKRK